MNSTTVELDTSRASLSPSTSESDFFDTSSDQDTLVTNDNNPENNTPASVGDISCCSHEWSYESLQLLEQPEVLSSNYNELIGEVLPDDAETIANTTRPCSKMMNMRRGATQKDQLVKARRRHMSFEAGKESSAGSNSSRQAHKNVFPSFSGVFNRTLERTRAMRLNRKMLKSRTEKDIVSKSVPEHAEGLEENQKLIEKVDSVPKKAINQVLNPDLS